MGSQNVRGGDARDESIEKESRGETLGKDGGRGQGGAPSGKRGWGEWQRRREVRENGNPPPPEKIGIVLPPGGLGGPSLIMVGGNKRGAFHALHAFAAASECEGVDSKTPA